MDIILFEDFYFFNTIYLIIYSFHIQHNLETNFLYSNEILIVTYIANIIIQDLEREIGS